MQIQVGCTVKLNCKLWQRMLGYTLLWYHVCHADYNNQFSVFFSFFFCTKIPVLVILVTEKKLKLPICMLLRKDGINQFVGTYIWHIYIWHIYIRGENINQRPVQLQGAHVSSPLPRRRKGTAGLTADLGKQEFWLWAKWERGRGYPVYWRRDWDGFRTAGIISAPPSQHQRHGVDARHRRWLNLQTGWYHV